MSYTPAYWLVGHKRTQTSGVMRWLSAVSLKVLYPVLEEKQPRRAKLPMVAGSWMGTMLSVGEGCDETDVVTDAEPATEGEETDEKAGFEGNKAEAGFEGKDMEEKAGPEGNTAVKDACVVLLLLASVGYGLVGTKVVTERTKEVEDVSSSGVLAVVAVNEYTSK